MPPTRKSLEVIFWEHVDMSGDCWLWTGPRRTHGAGECSYMDGARQRSIVAHRASWEIHNGMVPTGMKVIQLCGNALCVKPDHLRLSASRLTTFQRQYSLRDMPQEPAGCPQRDWKLFHDHVVGFRSIEHLADEHGMPVTTVRTIVERVGRLLDSPSQRHILQERPPGLTDRDWSIYVRCRHNHETMRTIAQDVGISGERVRQIVKAVEESIAVVQPCQT